MTVSHHAAYPARNGNEFDATSRKARRVIASLHRAGVVKATKEIMHRRERHAVRQELARQI